jgi:pimeloyl-ACP methyl ester carboxylesterase
VGPRELPGGGAGPALGPEERALELPHDPTSEHAADVKQAIAAMREVAPVPVWLVGTSMGSLSAANAAARLPEGGPDGIVLTSSVTETSKASYETTRHAGRSSS